MKRGLDARVPFERIQVPNIATFEGSRYALLLLQDVRSEMRILIAPLADVLANKAHWVAVADFEDEVTDAQIDGEALYLLANKGHPRGRVLRASLQSPAVGAAAEVIPQGDWVIEEPASCARRAVPADARWRLWRASSVWAATGACARSRCPSMARCGRSPADAEHEGGLFSFTGWLTPADIWSVDAAGQVARDRPHAEAARLMSARMRPSACSPRRATAPRCRTRSSIVRA